MGPILIFDKSALESFNVDESVWLDNFFICNITPLFYVESLSDLEKKPIDARSAEKLVVDLSTKTPVQSSCPNVAHHTLILNDLLGNKVDMSGRPIIAGGQTRISPDGKVGVFHDPFPEMEAFDRWQKGKFLEIEQKFAKGWRDTISNLDLDSTLAIVKNFVPTGTKLSSLEDIKTFVDGVVMESYKELIEFTAHIMGIPKRFTPSILNRWETEKQPSLASFAPYASFCMKIEIFFYLAIERSFISRDRPSNKVDISYLYYLPFCNVFASKDKLHKRVAPLFMEMGQTFIWADDLKNALHKIDEFFTNLPEETKRQGVYRFATYPPTDPQTLVAELWDKYASLWRGHKKEKEEVKDELIMKDPELVRHIDNLKNQSVPAGNDFLGFKRDPDHIILERRVPVRRGKWMLVPPEVVENAKKDKPEQSYAIG